MLPLLPFVTTYWNSWVIMKLTYVGQSFSHSLKWLFTLLKYMYEFLLLTLVMLIFLGSVAKKKKKRKLWGNQAEIPTGVLCSLIELSPIHFVIIVCLHSCTCWVILIQVQVLILLLLRLPRDKVMSSELPGIAPLQFCSSSIWLNTSNDLLPDFSLSECFDYRDALWLFWLKLQLLPPVFVKNGMGLPAEHGRILYSKYFWGT